jgi:lambda family phage portal protein
MGALDVIAKVAPKWAADYRANQLRYSVTSEASKNHAERLYDAATQTQYRKPITGGGSSPNRIMEHAGTKLRDLARHLEENHDLTNAVFDDLLNNVVGSGAKVAPMARRTNGELAVDFNKRIAELFEEWGQSPETTGDFAFEQVERQAARHLFRDGEIFIRRLVNSGGYQYPGRIPYALDLLDADYCPMDYVVAGQENGIIQGIEVDAWGAPAFYYFYSTHPGDFQTTKSLYNGNTARIGAANVIHLKHTKRLRQRRGVPLIHAVINRLQDVNAYEQSELIAAKVASDLTGFIKRNSEYNGDVSVNGDNNREFRMEAGAIFELLPGEDVGTISSDRPNSGLQDFRNAMMRAVAGGTGTRYSSISRDYNGTYSAQRQELQEGSIAYRTHFAYLARKFYRPIYSDFITTAILAGAAGSTRGIDLETITRADFRAPALPWIDPKKEADAYQILLNNKLESHSELIRQRGRDPLKVAEEIQAEQEAGVFASTIDLADVQPAQDNDDDEAAA